MRVLRLRSLLVLVVGGCGPATLPPEPVRVAPSTAAPAQEPAAASAAPDPLEGLSPEERRRWAASRMGGFSDAARGPAPTFDAIVTDGRITLHSPDLVEMLYADSFRQATCTPMDFTLRDGKLVTRAPVKGGRARPDLARDYVELTLGEYIEIGPTVTGPNGDMAMAAHDTNEGLLSVATTDLIRYQGGARLTVECIAQRFVRHCADGTTSECPNCLLTFIPMVPNLGIHGGEMHTAPGHACGPCPPNEAAALAAPLATIADAERLIELDENVGPSFFKDVRACRDEARRLPFPEPEPEGRLHGFPLHPEMISACITGSGSDSPVGTGSEIFETELSLAELTAWYQARLGTLERDGRKRRSLVHADPSDLWLEIGPPAAFEGSCADGFADETRAVVQIGFTGHR